MVVLMTGYKRIKIVSFQKWAASIYKLQSIARQLVNRLKDSTSNYDSQRTDRRGIDLSKHCLYREIKVPSNQTSDSFLSIFLSTSVVAKKF